MIDLIEERTRDIDQPPTLKNKMNDNDPFGVKTDDDGFGPDDVITENDHSIKQEVKKNKDIHNTEVYDDSDTDDDISTNKTRNNRDDNNYRDDDDDDPNCTDDTSMNRVAIDTKRFSCVERVRLSVGLIFCILVHSIITLSLFFWCYYDCIHYEFVKKVDDVTTLQHTVIWILWFGRLVFALLLCVFGLPLIMIGATSIESIIFRCKIDLWLIIKSAFLCIFNYIMIIIGSHIYGALIYASYPCIFYILFPFAGSDKFSDIDLLNSLYTFLVYLLCIVSVIWMIVMIPLFIALLVGYGIGMKWSISIIARSYDNSSMREVLISLMRRRGFFMSIDHKMERYYES